MCLILPNLALNYDILVLKAFQIRVKKAKGFWYCQTRLKRTARDRLNLFIITGFRYNRADLCSKMTILDFFKCLS